jgi:hypothetical protein
MSADHDILRTAAVSLSAGHRSAITLGSKVPREGRASPGEPFQAPLERGEIDDQQYEGLLYVHEYDTIAHRAYARRTDAPRQTTTRDLADPVAKQLIDVPSG